MNKRILSMLLALVMVLGLFPAIPASVTAADAPAFTVQPLGGACVDGMTVTVSWETNFTPVKQLLVRTVQHPVDGLVKTRTPLSATATSCELSPNSSGYYTILAYHSETEYVSSINITVPKLSRGTELLFTDDTIFESGTAVTIDIEAMAEQDEVLMEAYLDNAVTYQWRLDGSVIPYYNHDYYEINDADVGKELQAVVFYGDSMSISDSRIVEEASSIWLGGVRMTEGTYLANGAEHVSLDQPDNPGYAHYKDGTLTLVNYVYEGEGHRVRNSSHLLYTAAQLNLELIGSSRLAQTGSVFNTCVYSEKDINVFGDGSVDIFGGYYSLYSAQSISIGRGTINSSDVNVGIQCVGDLYIDGGNISVNARESGLLAGGSIGIYGGNLDIITTTEYPSDDSCAISSDSISFARNLSVLAATEPDGTFVEYDPANNSTYRHIRITPAPEVWVGGVGMYQDTYLANGADATTTEQPEGGFAYYSDGTLVLCDFGYEGPGYAFENSLGVVFGAAVYSKEPLNVYLQGENVLNQTVENYSIYCEDDLIIEGPGSLYATYEIDSQLGDIWIEGGTINTAELDIDVDAVNGSVAVNGGTVNTSIRACFDIEIVKGTVNAVSNYAALDAGRDITIYGGSVTAKTTHHWPDENNWAIEYGGEFTVMDSLIIRACTDPDGIPGEYLAQEHDSYDLVVISEPAFTLQPESGEVPEGEALTVTWETNFEPLRIEVYYLDNGDEVLDQTLPGNAISAQVSVREEAYFIAAYYSDSIRVDSDCFRANYGECATVYFCFGDSPVASQDVVLGQCAKEPEAPAREGCDFLGWYTAEGELYDFSTPVTGDLYLYAKFGHYVIFCFGETPIAGQGVEHGACAIEPEAPGQEGKIFLGWFTAEGELYDFSTPVTQEIWLYARWQDVPVFTDVPEDSFYYDPVMWAVENGITNGATATTFNPGGNCLRAHVVTFLHRANQNPEPKSQTSPFTDVKPGDFFFKPVLWAVDAGITNGISATEFGSYANCNRAAVVTFLWRSMGCPEPKAVNNPFVDVKSTDFYYKAVLWAVECGITNGLDATHFGPATACNRAQVVTFLYRAYN